MRLMIRIVASFFVGLFLLIPLGAIYGIAGLPVFHSWGLMHGSFTTAIPALISAGFICLGLVPWFGPTIDPASRILTSLSVFPLVTVLYWVDQYANHAMFSIWHAVTYITVFCMLAILCIKSHKPLLIPLFLVVPVLIDPLFGLLITGFNGLSGNEIFVYDLQSKVLPLIVASTAALALVHYINVRRASL